MIWQGVPDFTKLFWLDGLSEEEFNRVLGANGTLINSNENEHTEWLNRWLYGEEGGERRYTPIAEDHKIAPNDLIRLLGPCYVVLSGFVL